MEFKKEFDECLAAITAATKDQAVDSKSVQILIDELQDSVKDRVHTLSTYDTEKYEALLQQARTDSWKTQRPKRFQFKNKRQDPHAPSTHASMRAAPALIRSRTPSSDTKSLVDTEGAKGAQPAKKVGLVEILSDPRVNLSLSNYSGSVVVAPQIESSFYGSNLEDCKIVVRCQQLRIHDSHNVEIWLERCENPIIEGCSGLVFHAPDLSTFKVSDFQWMMESQPSPNYTVQAPAEDGATWKPAASYTQDDAEKLIHGVNLMRSQ